MPRKQPNKVLLLLVPFITTARATVHHLFAASFNGNFIAGLEFDTEANTLVVVSNTTTTATHGWITLKVRIPIAFAIELYSLLRFRPTHQPCTELRGQPLVPLTHTL